MAMQGEQPCSVKISQSHSKQDTGHTKCTAVCHAQTHRTGNYCVVCLTCHSHQHFNMPPPPPPNITRLKENVLKHTNLTIIKLLQLKKHLQKIETHKWLKKKKGGVCCGAFLVVFPPFLGVGGGWGGGEEEQYKTTCNKLDIDFFHAVNRLVDIFSRKPWQNWNDFSSSCHQECKMECQHENVPLSIMLALCLGKSWQINHFISFIVFLNNNCLLIHLLLSKGKLLKMSKFLSFFKPLWSFYFSR